MCVNVVASNFGNYFFEATQASARAAASESAPIIFHVAKGVVLELAEPPASGWIKVKHRDGDIGYIKALEVWGE